MGNRASCHLLPSQICSSEGRVRSLAGVNSLFHPSWCCPEPTLYSPNMGRGIRRWHLQKVLPSSLCWVQQLSRGLPALCMYPFAERNLWDRLNLEEKGKNKNFSLDWVPPPFNISPVEREPVISKSPCQRSWAQSPFILPVNLEGFPQHEDWAASPTGGKQEPRSSKLIQQVTQGINKHSVQVRLFHGGNLVFID